MSAFRFLAAMAVAACAAGAAAQDSAAPCGFETAILELADRIFEVRSELTGFAPGRYGTEAAYFRIVYDDSAGPADAFRLIRAVRDGYSRRTQDLDELEMTYAVSRFGPEAGLAVRGSDPLESFVEARQSLMRAILLWDDGQSFFRLMRQLAERPELDQRYRSYPRQTMLAYVLLDQDDTTKTRIAEHALAAGETAAAALILATRSELGAYRDLVAQHGADKLFMALAGPVTVDATGLAQLHHRATVRDLSAEEPEDAIIRLQLHLVLRAAFYARQTDILLISLNQSGRTEELARVAERYLRDLEAGALAPGHDAEVTLLAAYDGMVRELGLQEAQRVLIAFDMPPKFRHFAGRAQHTIDWLVAKRAIAPFVTGAAAAPPSRPAELSDDFDWDKWTDAARWVITGSPDLPDEESARMAVEHYWLRGEVQRAMDHARHLIPQQTRIQIYQDFLERLDRQCRAVSVYPGRAMLLGGGLLYRFP